jgi:hypothetical protein
MQSAKLPRSLSPLPINNCGQKFGAKKRDFGSTEKTEPRVRNEMKTVHYHLKNVRYESKMLSTETICNVISTSAI